MLRNRRIYLTYCLFPLCFFIPINHRQTITFDHHNQSQHKQHKKNQKPYSVNLLIAGFDVKTNKPSLYWLDHLASLADVPFAAHGYGAYYCLSLLDRYHREDITEEEGIKLLQKCVGELRSRMILNMPDFVAKVVNKDGIRIVQL